MRTAEIHSAPQAKTILRTTSAGYEFNENSDRWQLDGSVSLHLGFLTEWGIDEQTAEGFRRAMSRCAQDYSPRSCAAICYEVRKFFKFASPKEFTAEALSAWREHLDDERLVELGRLRSFLENWYEWGFPGIRKKAIDYLDSLTCKGSPKGIAVLTNCPFSGPYTSLEHQALLCGLADAYSAKRLTQDAYSFLLAIAMTGRRPIQIRHLKFCDLGFEDAEGMRTYHLDIPRAKQRGGTSFREHIKSVAICKDLFDALDDQRNNVIRWVESNLGKVDEEVQSSLPLFPEYGRLAACSDLNIASLLKIDYLHITSSSVARLSSRLNQSVIAHSERTADRLIIGFTRLRRTFGTNLAREGFGLSVVAEALDHSDTQNVGVYARPENETAKVVDAVMAPVLAPLAMAFAGTLVDSERDAVRGNDPHSRVKLENAIDVGSCGNHAFCADGWKSCYVCKNFQPWLDGPHAQARDKLLEERQTQLDAGVSKTVISASDRTLLAIVQVIQMCANRKAELITVDGVCCHE